MCFRDKIGAADVLARRCSLPFGSMWADTQKFLSKAHCTVASSSGSSCPFGTAHLVPTLRTAVLWW